MSDDLFSADDLDQELLARQAAQKPAVSRQVRKEEKALAPLTGKTLYIIDGYSLIYRSYFAFLSRPLTDSQGNNVSAFFGFFNTIFMLIRDYEFDYFVVAMDSKGPTFRHRMYEPYKANREAAPQDLHSQVPLIMDALEKLNIPYIAREGYEADDLIATLAANASRLGIETVMVTGDKDLLQLVDDRVRALRPPKKNQPRYTLFGADEVKAEFGISPSQSCLRNTSRLTGSTDIWTPCQRDCGQSWKKGAWMPTCPVTWSDSRAMCSRWTALIQASSSQAQSTTRARLRSSGNTTVSHWPRARLLWPAE